MIAGESAIEIRIDYLLRAKLCHGRLGPVMWAHVKVQTDAVHVELRSLRSDGKGATLLLHRCRALGRLQAIHHRLSLRVQHCLFHSAMFGIVYRTPEMSRSSMA